MNYQEAVRLHGSIRGAARELNMPESTLRGRLKNGSDLAVQAAMDAANTKLIPKSLWVKTKDYSVQLYPPQDTPVDYRSLFDNINAAPIVAPPSVTDTDLCTVYPLMDVHLGMRAWDRETGAQSYDLDLAAQDMRTAFADVMALTPSSDQAVLILGGDILHADDTRAETPKSHHKLDVDGRHHKVLEASIQILADVVESLSRKHRNVLIRVLRGNHDEHSHMVLHFALQQRYRNDPRIVVEDCARDLFMMQWGSCSIFAHHGDKAKPQQLALYLSDVCPFWSATRHRHLLTGHIHHDSAKDVGPLRWESLRAFCPPDAYAASMGYGGRRALQALTFHKIRGLRLRVLDPIERYEDDVPRLA